MLQSLNIPTLLLVLAFSSCTKTDIKPASSDSVSQDIFSARTASGGKVNLSAVPLRVTVHNTDAYGNAYNIQNDLQGDYVHGVGSVRAELTSSGTFAFDTYYPTVKRNPPPASRWVEYNFNNPVDLNNTYRPSPNNRNNYHFSTGGASTGTQPFIAIQNLGINGNPATECIYMGNGISNGVTSWRVSFRKGCEDTQASPTALAVVTRTKIKAVHGTDEWIIQPLGLCLPETNNNVAALRIDDGTSCTASLKGYYYLPFKLTFTAL